MTKNRVSVRAAEEAAFYVVSRLTPLRERAFNFWDYNLSVAGTAQGGTTAIS
ncbi:MAG TPA: hypothetical protein PLM33_03405 [Acidobacteriota bacterium]|nr:hypothetical protein [Acidobacteriota bacterium]